MSVAIVKRLVSLLSAVTLVSAAAWASGCAGEAKDHDAEEAHAVHETAGESEAGEEAAEEGTGAAVGTAAPDFTLTSADGKHTVTLSEQKGKIVVVQFYNHDCPWVVKSRFDSQAIEAEYKDKGVVWYWIDCTHNRTAEKNAEEAAEHEFTQPILMNPEGDVGKAYRAKQTPESFVIDKEGVVRYRGAFDNRTDPQTAGDVNYVRNAIQALVDGKEVEPATVKAFGCTIKYKPKAEEGEDAEE